MSSQFFVKFEYQGKIKKIGVLKNDFTWLNMCKALSKAFSISESDISLSYRDPDDDLITACCDEDLIEAHKLASTSQALKFYVKKNKKIEKSQEKAPRKREYLRANSLNNQENTLVNALAAKKDHSDGQVRLKERSENTSVQKEEPKVEAKTVDVNFADVEEVLSKLLKTKEAKQEIKDLKARLGLVDSLKDANAQLINFNIQQQKIADYITDAFRKILLSTGDEDQANGNSVVKSEPTEEEKIEFKKQNLSNSLEKNILNVSLKESIYEASYPNIITKVDAGDFKTKSINNNSTSFCRDLSSTHGVKLALKFENGKMKLMSIPMHEYSIIESAEESLERLKMSSDVKL